MALLVNNIGKEIWHTIGDVMLRKQISQAQYDYYQFVEKQADKPGDSWFNRCGVPLKCVHYPNIALYSSVKLIKDSDVVSEQDKKLLNKFCRQWLTKQGNLSQAYMAKIKNKTTYYGYKLKNKVLRQERLARQAQKKSV